MDGGGCSQRLRRAGSAGVWRWRVQTPATPHHDQASLCSSQHHGAAA